MAHENAPQPQGPIHDPLQQTEQIVNAAALDGRGSFGPEHAAHSSRAMQQVKAGLGRSALSGNFARRNSLSRWGTRHLDEMRYNNVHDDHTE